MSITATQDVAWEIQGLDFSGTQQLDWSIDPFRPSIGAFQAITWALGVTGDTTTVFINGAPSGLVGSLTVEVQTFDGTIFVHFRTTSGIIEVPEGSGRYQATIPYPDVGRYWVVWRHADVVRYEELDVIQEHRWPPAFVQERWAANLA